MGFIFDFLGSLFGYILWFFFDAVSNYGIAILLFTLFINILMFPLLIKQQKSMTKNAKLAAKQDELKKKYGKNPQKYNEEMAKLYEREGNPMKGCLTMFLPILLLFGILGVINKPLQNTLHIPAETVKQSIEKLSEIPGIGESVSTKYPELEIVRRFSGVRGELTMFSEEHIADIEEFSNGFNFMGLDLLDTPSNSSFGSMMWLIPVIYVVISILATHVRNKMSGRQMEMPGCGKIFPYVAPIFFAWVIYTTPGAVGLYWIINAIVGVVQNIILGKYFNEFTINAKAEAQRLALLEITEKNVEMIKDPSSISCEGEEDFRGNQGNVTKKNKKK